MSPCTRLALLLLLGTLATPVRGEFYATLSADDQEPFDQFGLAVAISGNSAIVGGDQNDVLGGQETGAVYLFDVATGDQIVKFTAADTAPFDRFGSAVGINRQTAIVGANLHDDAGRNSGAAYLFDVATGRQLHKLTANDASAFDRLAWSVAIYDNIAAATTRSNGDSVVLSGAAYLFDVTTGQQLHKLTGNDSPPEAEDFFGWSVAVNSSTALVGAIGDDHAGPNTGAVYVFDVASGNQTAKLTANDASSFDRFGTAVAISGNTAIVTARTGSAGGDFAGAAYLFDLTTGDQIAKLVPGEATPLDRFGWSVAADGHIAVIGAILGASPDGTRSGTAYVFDVTSGIELGRVSADEVLDTGDSFGWSVGISGNTAIISAPNSVSETGLSFLLDLEQITTTPEPATLSWLAILSLAMVSRRPRPYQGSGLSRNRIAHR